MAYATRHSPATIGGNSADDRGPYFHDVCVATDDDGFALDHSRVWLGKGACGFDDEVCGACGQPLKIEP